MGNVNLHINYTLADIQRYLSGKLSPGEMHDMEKAALLDPFLADALEGYAAAPLPLAAQHLNQIAASLQQPQNGSIIAPLAEAGTRWQWWKIVAIVIVIAGAGSLTWKLLQSPNGTTVPQQNLAQKQTVPVPPAPPAPARQIAPQADSLKPVPGSVSASTQSTRPIASVSAEQGRMRALEEKVAPDLSALLEKKEAAAAATAADITAREQLALSEAAKSKQESNSRMDSSMLLKQSFASAYKRALPYSSAKETSDQAAARAVAPNMLRGTITDDSGSPITGASVKVVNGNAVSITDDKGRFALRTMDTAARIEITSLGFETKQAGVSISKNNTVLLDAEDESLSDMVVTELYSRKKTTPVAEASVADTLYPAGGWQSFQEYAYRKIHQEMDTTGGIQHIEGTIELEFAIDEVGKPRDFKVIHSSNNSLNGKAISVLQNGPVWIGDKKKKARVKVRF